MPRSARSAVLVTALSPNFHRTCGDGKNNVRTSRRSSLIAKTSDREESVNRAITRFWGRMRKTFNAQLSTLKWAAPLPVLRSES